MVKNIKAKELWKTLGDIPIDNTECIEEPFLDFPIGTDRYSIWCWFEKTFNLSVAEDLMELLKKKRVLNTKEFEKLYQQKPVLDPEYEHYLKL